jgi:translation initiation factor 1A
MIEYQEERVRMPGKGEMLGVIESMMGTNKVKVLCQDGKIRLCRIPGKMRKRRWMHEENVIILKPWSIQGEKFADVLYVYTPTQAGWLRRNGILKIG